MPETNTDYVSAVNEVISVCKDAEAGFLGAAKAVDDPTTESTFEEYAKQRAKFASDLQDAVRKLGGEPETPSGVAGKLHSGWIALKGAVTGHSEHEILVETERGEDLSVKTYRDALVEELPEEIRSILEAQYEQVQLAHTHIRNMRDNTA